MKLLILLSFFILLLNLEGCGFSQKTFATKLADSSQKSKDKVTKVSELVIYTSRKEHLIRPVLKVFEKKYEGQIKIKYFTDKAGVLLQKLLIEKQNSPADILMTVDVGNLYRAQKKGLFEKWNSSQLNKRIPAHLRDKQGHWYGFSIRARTIFYNQKKVSQEDLVDYASLAEPQWKGRVCLRTSKKVYTQSLVASFIYHYGAEKTEKIVSGWIKNLAAPVFSSDTKLLEAIDRGRCDVGVANSYYYGRLVKKAQAKNVKIFWPKESRNGTHVNISGAGVLKNSKNKIWAHRFLNWLSGSKAQKLFAELNLEYPVVNKTSIDKIVKSFGSFKPDKMPLVEVGKAQIAAIKLMDRLGYK